MWVKRNREEIDQYVTAMKKEARGHGLSWAAVFFFGGGILSITGWFIGIRSGIILFRENPHRLETRLLAFALFVVPVSLIAYFRVKRKALRKLEKDTICVRCDTVSNGNEGMQCGCGGHFIPAASVKWVEDE